MSTCYDCACSRIETDGSRRFLVCGILDFCVLFTLPAPNICSKFLKRSGYSALEVLTPDEKEKYFEIYRKLPSYNPEVSPEEFFKNMDSGFLGIYPENALDIVKTVDSIKVPDEDSIKLVSSDTVELQKTKSMEPNELSEETKFRIYKLIVDEIGKHFYNCEMRMSSKDFILVEECIRKVLKGEQDERKTD
jgi:hypothetical protein|nr:MAG TPA: hypothetical protein [Siphoviridae sp. ctnoo6]